HDGTVSRTRRHRGESLVDGLRRLHVRHPGPHRCARRHALRHGLLRLGRVHGRLPRHPRRPEGAGPGRGPHRLRCHRNADPAAVSRPTLVPAGCGRLVPLARPAFSMIMTCDAATDGAGPCNSHTQSKARGVDMKPARYTPKKFNPARRGATLVAAVSMTLAAGAAQAEGKVIIASWGGSYQEAQSNALFVPASEATGVEVIEETYGGMADVRLKVNA